MSANRFSLQLAEKHNGAQRWGYRGVHCGQVSARGRPPNTTTTNQDPNQDPSSHPLPKRSKDALALLRRAGVPEDLDWVVPEQVDAYSSMGDPSTTAQVHPYQFTKAMAELSEEKGVRILVGASVTKILEEGGRVKGVSYVQKLKEGADNNKGEEEGNNEEEEAEEEGEEEEKVLEADTIILSAGPWTPKVYPPIPITAMRAHSIVIRPSRPVSAYALFTEISIPSSNPSKRRSTKTATPEIYARPNNEVYACGEADTLIPLPPSTPLVQTSDSKCADIFTQVSSISSELANGEVLAKQACYLPNVRGGGGGGGPIIGNVEGVKGLVVAAGHTCWGIQNAPGTGCVVAELVMEGKVKSARIGELEPGRFF